MIKPILCFLILLEFINASAQSTKLQELKEQLANHPQQDIISQDIGRVLLNLYNNAFYAVNEKKQKLIGSFEPVMNVSIKNENDS